MSKKFYAVIKKGIYKDKIAMITNGPTDEDILQYEKEWYNKIDEKKLAKELIDSMTAPQNKNLDQKLGTFLRIEEASELISKYMAELATNQFKGGCCG